jgi:hypothetical protein
LWRWMVSGHCIRPVLVALPTGAQFHRSCFGRKSHNSSLHFLFL